MNQNDMKRPRSLAAWKKPELLVLDDDLGDIETARNAGSDGGNGRSTSGS